MIIKWMFGIISLGGLYLFNSIYGFIPETILQRYSYIKVIGICVVLILFVVWIFEKAFEYQRLSFAKVSSSGAIVKSKKFKYNTIKATAEDGSILYIIENFYSEALLDIKTTRNLKYELSTRASGIGIQMFAKGSKGIKIESDFIIEMKR